MLSKDFSGTLVAEVEKYLLWDDGNRITIYLNYLYDDIILCVYNHEDTIRFLKKMYYPQENLKRVCVLITFKNGVVKQIKSMDEKYIIQIEDKNRDIDEPKTLIGKNFVSQIYANIERIISSHKLRLLSEHVSLYFYKTSENIFCCSVFVSSYDNSPERILINSEEFDVDFLAKLETILIKANKDILDKLHKSFMRPPKPFYDDLNCTCTLGGTVNLGVKRLDF